VSAGVGRCRNVSYQSGPPGRPASSSVYYFFVWKLGRVFLPETSNNNTEENPAVSESFVQSWSIRLAVIVCGGLLETSFPPSSSVIGCFIVGTPHFLGVSVVRFSPPPTCASFFFPFLGPEVQRSSTCSYKSLHAPHSGHAISSPLEAVMIITISHDGVPYVTPSDICT
jgi:hypothetical protein